MEAEKLKINFQKKLWKTVTYRITASSLAQILSWVFFRRVEINAVVLVVDMIQTVYYFFFDSIWGMDKRQIKSMKDPVGLAYDFRDLLQRRGYSDKAVKEIRKWYDFS